MRTSRRVGPRVVLGLVVLIVIGLAVMQIAGGGTQMKKLFASEVQEELKKTTFSTEVFTEEDFATLPAALERYFLHVGFVDQLKISNARIVFEEVDFNNGSMNLKLYAEQFNFVQEPARIAYMIAKMAGVISSVQFDVDQL